MTEENEYEKFDFIRSQKDQIWAMKRVDSLERWVLLNNIGEQISTTNFPEPFPLSAEQIPLKENGLWGIFAPQSQTWLVPPKYLCFSEPISGVFKCQRLDGQYDLRVATVDKNETFGPFEAVSVAFNGVPFESDDNSPVILFYLKEKNGSYFFMDHEGNRTSNPNKIEQLEKEIAYGIYGINFGHCAVQFPNFRIINFQRAGVFNQHGELPN